MSWRELKVRLSRKLMNMKKTVKEKVEIGRQLASNEKLVEALSQESEVLKADI